MSNNSAEELVKIPEPICTQLHNIYFEHVGFAKHWELQKKACFSSVLMGIALLLALLFLFFGSSLSGLENSGLVVVIGLFVYWSYRAREVWIKKKLSLDSHKHWLDKQKVTAYFEAKEKNLFNKSDSGHDCMAIFNKDTSFLGSKANMIVAGSIVPVWSVFLSKIEIEFVIKILAIFIGIGALIIYINYLFHVFASSKKNEFLRWIKSCRDFEEKG